MKLPKRPLTNVDLQKFAKKLKIAHFRGVFMLDDLQSQRPQPIESGIVNLDTNAGVGTHWVAYYKNGDTVQYFDSFGNLRPPSEVLAYFKTCKQVVYNHCAFQSFSDTYNCGHLCLKFLKAYS